MGLSVQERVQSFGITAHGMYQRLRKRGVECSRTSVNRTINRPDPDYEPSLRLCMEIARELNVSVEDLFDESRPWPPKGAYVDSEDAMERAAYRVFGRIIQAAAAAMPTDAGSPTADAATGIAQADPDAEGRASDEGA